jgi:hypothetical protein
MNFHRISFSSTALLLVSSITALNSQTPSRTSDAFPLAKGSYWIYQCQVSKQNPGSPRIEKSLTWKMGILETLHRDAITVALIEGHPRDFLDLMGEQGRRDYLIISRSGRKFYLVEPPDSLPLLALLKNPRSDWSRELGRREREGSDQLFLELPLEPGKAFPSERRASAQTAPGVFSWLVKDRQAVTLKAVEGDAPADTVTQYTLTYGLNKSDTTLSFVPGVGITSYSYHGYAGVPPDQIEWQGQLQLAEYHRAAPE